MIRMYANANFVLLFELSRSSLKIRSGGKDLSASSAYPKMFGRTVAGLHTKWLVKTLAQIVSVMIYASDLDVCLNCVIKATDPDMPDLEAFVEHGFQDLHHDGPSQILHGTKLSCGAHVLDARVRPALKSWMRVCHPGAWR